MVPGEGKTRAFTAFVVDTQIIYHRKMNVIKCIDVFIGTSIFEGYIEHLCFRIRNQNFRSSFVLLMLSQNFV